MSGVVSSPLHPDVSVIVVTRNDRERLIDCLRSLEEQACESIEAEVIVVDDGSTDGTAEAVGGLFPQVRLIRKPGEGADISRNRGIAESRGAMVAFIDSDCVASRDWLETLVGELKKNVVAVVGGRVIHRGPFLRRIVGIADFGEYQGLTRTAVRSLPTCNLGLTRSILGEVQFDPRLADAGGDTLFTERLRRSGADLTFLPDLVVEHRPAVGFGDLMQRAGRYGRSFVRARQVDPTLRYAGFVRAGVLGVVAATFARVVLDWTRLVQNRRAAGFAVWEVPAAAAVLAVRRLVSLPAAVRALRN